MGKLQGVSMTDAQIARLEQRRERLLDELRHLPDLMRGKVYARERKCGRASCTCASGGPRHPGLQLTVNLGGRTRTRYVRQGERAAVEAKVAAYRRLWELVDEVTEVNLALLNARPVEAQEKE
jgi:hypothetical protein